MSAGLAHQQQALLQALLDWPPQDATKTLAVHAIDTRGRGLKAYQSNAHALAQRALLAAYPAVTAMLGGESFAELARALWHVHPPRLGDAARWGEALADFVATDAQLQEYPYLADVARCEWALHRAAFAADAHADPASLARLAHEDPAQLGLVLAPGAAWVQSRWPIHALLGTHLLGRPALSDVAELLREAVAQDVVVWRQGLQCQWREALPGEAGLLAALQQGDSVLAATEAAAELDFAQWLPLAVRGGLVVRVVGREVLS